MVVAACFVSEVLVRFMRMGLDREGREEGEEGGRSVDGPILIAIPPDLGAQRSTSASAASATFIALAVALSCGNMSAESMAHLPLPVWDD